jgi:hypothetical protein
MALSGIRITDLPVDTNLVAAGDTFFKVKSVNGVLSSFQFDGTTFLQSFSGISTLNSLGGGLPFYSSLTPDGRGVNFNTLAGGTGISVTSNNNLINVQVAGANFITPNMLEPNCVDSTKIVNNGISNQSIAPNTIQYSNLLNSSSPQGVQQRLSKMWVNFDGTAVANWTPANNYTLQGVRSSNGVLGVLRLGQPGVYAIAFSQPMNDNYYAIIGNANDPGGIATLLSVYQQTTYCEVAVARTAPMEYYDVTNISVIIFGN